MKNRKSKDEVFVKKHLDDIRTSSISRKRWQIYLPVGIIGILVAATMWYTMNTSTKIAKQYSPLVDAAMEIKFEATTAHLWLEEIISGDNNEDINEVWDHINRAEWFARAMLEGGQNNEGTFIPLDNQTLRHNILEVIESIRDFRNIAKKRYGNFENASIGSNIDQHFDSVFKSLIEQADEVEFALQKAINKEIQHFQLIQIILIVVSLIFTSIIGMILNRYEQKQSINLSLLVASNQQLIASEQQLKASNQQLIAGEQQLRATNQQLIAGEQQLRATNQQLTAGEQQLKATNQRLHQSLQKLALHVQQTPLGVIQWDLNWKVTEWNNAAEKIFGFTSEEAFGQHAAGLIVPESVKPIVDKVWDELLAQKGGTRSTNENITKNNDTIICEWYNTPLIDENGETIGVASLVMDITKRKQVEDALYKSEKKYRTLFEKSADALLIIEEDKFIDCNPETVKMLGYKDKKELLETHPSILSPELQPDGRKSFEKANDYMSIAYAQGSHRFEWIHKRKNGNLFPVEVLLTSIPFGEKKFLHVVWRDITERKLAEEALKESKTQYEHLFNSMIDGFALHEIICDDSGKPVDYRFLSINPAFELQTGLKAADLIGKRAYEVLPGLEPIWVEKYGSVALTGKAISFDEYSAVLNKHFEVTAYQPVVGMFACIFTDVTETKRLQKLELRAERLEMAGTIAGQVAHDFNNLLGPIMAYPDLIREKLPHDDKTRAYLDDIENAAKKIANINQDLLTMGRRGHYNLEVLNLNKIILQAAKEIELQSKDIICQMNLEKDLMNLKGGTAQIHRLLTNLFVNAQDSMQNIGKICIKTENYYANDTSISFGRVPKGEYVKLTITDFGCGIPKDIIQKIMDPFFSTKTTDKERGSGLGLSVVDAVLKDHHGYLDLSSKVGQGTSFYIYFPITREDITETEIQNNLSGSESILVVDDDEIQREVATVLLTKLGYKVNTVESGEEAVEFLKNNSQELVILDMVMPGGIDGAETYKRILEIYPNQKAIILSGFSETDRVVEAQKLGAGAFVRKPVTKKGIASAVRTELDRSVEISKT